MNTIKTFMLLLIIAVFTACSNDDSPKNNPPLVEDVTMDISNLKSDLVTTVIATDLDEDELTYTIVSQVPVNSVSINSTNGEIYVSNASAFNYDQNTKITVSLSVSDGIDNTRAELIINIIDRS